jgi:hypothetical protein
MPIIYSISDHAAILLSTDGPIRRIKRSFKFENWWIKEQDFQDHAKSAWLSTMDKPFSCRTNHLAGALKIWCKKKPLQQELNNLEEQMKQIQMKPLINQDHNLETSLVTRYEQTMTKVTDSYTLTCRERKNSGLRMVTGIPLSSIMPLSKQEEGTPLF